MEPRKSHIGAILVVIVLTFLVAENAFLFFRNQRLEKFVAATSARKPQAGLKVGEKVPSIELQNLSGSPSRLDVAKDKLIFIYSSTCPFCRKNFSNWKDIEKQVGRENVVYIATDKLEAAKPFAHDQGIEGEAYVVPDASQASKLKVERIPQTIHVVNGVVANIYIGVLNPDAIKEVSQFGSQSSPINSSMEVVQ
jgi:hypothetical protein